MAATGNIRHDLERTEPDVSPERARSTWLLFMPGVTASLLMFVVFGTTKNNLAYMGSCLCPQRRDKHPSCRRGRPVISSPRLQSNSHILGGVGVAPDIAMSKPSLSHQSSLRSDIRPAPRPPPAAAATAGKARLHLGGDLMKPLPPTPPSQAPLPPTPEIWEVVAGELFRNDIRRPLDWRQRDAYSGKRFAPR
jgi:hypothetical protein